MRVSLLSVFFILFFSIVLNNQEMYSNNDLEKLNLEWEESCIELHKEIDNLNCSKVVGIALSTVGITSILYFVIFDYLI